jgi:uncharacterized peroxidase-related enzyme
MNGFIVYTKENAPQASQALLADREKKYGFLPNLFGAFAGSPAVLEAYISISNLLEKTSLTPQEQQIVLLAVSVENGCEYCVAAHSMVAHMMAKVPSDIVDALRNGTNIADKRINALVGFTRTMVQKRGYAVQDDLQRFFDGGYTQAQALEVILGITMKTLSNYTNHIVDTPLDKAFESQQWHKQNASV